MGYSQMSPISWGATRTFPSTKFPSKRRRGKGKIMNSKRISRHGFRWLIGGNDLYDLGLWALVIGALAVCVIGFGIPMGFRISGVIFFVVLGIAQIYTARREFGPLERISRILIFLRFLRIRRHGGNPFDPPSITYAAWGIGVLLAAAYIVASGWQSPEETVATAILSLTLFGGGGLFWHERLKKTQRRPRRRNGWV